MELKKTQFSKLTKLVGVNNRDIPEGLLMEGDLSASMGKFNTGEPYLMIAKPNGYYIRTSPVKNIEVDPITDKHTVTTQNSTYILEA